MALTKEEELFLQAIGEFLRGDSEGDCCGETSGEALGELYRLSQIHAVVPMVYEAAERIKTSGEDAERILAQWKRQAMNSVFLQTVKTEAFLGVCRRWNEENVRAVVVKGILCRRLYPKPDHRPSSDEDVFAAGEDWERAREVLLGSGFEITDGDSPGQQVTTFSDPASGLRIELHRELFSHDSAAYGELGGVFAGAEERAVRVEVSGVPVWSMCPTEHMLYLVFHAFKHFLHSGFGIRQVCDICLFAREYAAEIDWNAAGEVLREHSADVFASAVLKIGEKYLGVPCSALLQADSPDPDDLLSDILAGGVYGSSSSDRQHSSLITLDAASAPAKAQSSHVLKTLFPPKSYLAGKYPYLSSKPWLLPAAWLQRISEYLLKGGSARASVRIGSDRVRLMKKYGVIK